MLCDDTRYAAWRPQTCAKIEQHLRLSGSLPSRAKNATVNQPDVARIHRCKKVAKREEMAALRECEVEFEVCRSTRRVFAKKTEICHPIGPRVSAALRVELR